MHEYTLKTRLENSHNGEFRFSYTYTHTGSFQEAIDSKFSMEELEAYSEEYEQWLDSLPQEELN